MKDTPWSLLVIRVRGQAASGELPRAAAAKAASIAPQVTRSSGKRSRLLRVQRRAALSVIAAGAARSKASAPAYLSAMAFRLARPASKSLPIMRSMLKKIPISLEM
jgi:hypothetical protein